MPNLSKNSDVPNADTWMTARERYQPHATPAWAMLFAQDANPQMDIAMPSRAGISASNSEQARDERVARKLTVRAAT